MEGRLTLEDLAALVDGDAVDTVVAAFVDGHGCLRGTRLHARRFLASARADPQVHGAEAAGIVLDAGSGETAWTLGAGGGDPCLRPDLGTLRRAAWLPGTALVLCDPFEAEGSTVFAQAPRQVLRRQIARLRDAGLAATVATELDYVVLDGVTSGLADDALRRQFTVAEPGSALTLCASSDASMRRLRKDLCETGIQVDRTSAGTGRERLALGSAPALTAADHHVIARHAARDIGIMAGRAVTFLPVLPSDPEGSGCRIVLSLWSGREPAFVDSSLPHGISRLARAFVGGILRSLDDCMVFLVPSVNGYKRIRAGGPAPLRKVWSIGDRNAAVRLRRAGTGAVALECRVSGADANPHLAIAALLAAGLDGMAQHLDCGDPASTEGAPDSGARVLGCLREAVLALQGSAMLRAAMGDAVVDHYCGTARAEQVAFDGAITDWEILRALSLG